MSNRPLSPTSLFPLLQALCLLLACTMASANGKDLEIEGITLPGHTLLGGQQLTLNGAGTRRLLGFHVYVAALYLAQPTTDASEILARDQPRRLQLTLLFDTSTKRHVEALKDGLAANNSEAELRAIEPEVEHFLALIRRLGEVRSGTDILLDYLPGQGTRIQVGSQDLGIIAGERFNRDILKIWLGEAPIQLSLKTALLGKRNS